MPAPVLPVVALIFISPFTSPLLILGLNPKRIAVAKHPGFAIFELFFISSWLISGKP